MTTPTFLLVHGAWCGDWVFWKLTPALEARGLPWVSTDLPSCRATDARVGPIDDIAYVGGVLDQIDGPVVVVGKSYGGTVISGVTVDRPQVQHLVYVAAMMPAPGEPLQQMTLAAITPEIGAGLRFTDDGRLALDPEVGATCGFTQASDEDKDVWRREGRPMANGTDPAMSLDRVGWEQVESTYLVCTEDRTIKVESQRAWAAQATHTIERPWDHSPGVSHPEELADLLVELAGG
jgi:pimeloyl-ACP methyl ester carboxylesterase